VRWKPFRITNPWLKFVAIAVGAGARLAFWLVPADFAPLAIELFYLASGLALIYLATRVFRVREEPLVRPRAWWRATGRPTAGFVIAALVGTSTVLSFLRFAPTWDGVVSLVAVYLPWLVIATFFAHSSIRLLKMPKTPGLLPTRRSDW
jgi:hypothetical protein